MIYIPNEKEFQTLIHAPLDKRVKNFQNRVGGLCYLWLCYDDDGNLFGQHNKSDGECISVWPAEVYAKEILKREDYRWLKPMEIHKFLNEYLDELKENNIKILVFPTEDGGALFDADNFRNMMEEELLKYEDLEEN